MTQDFMTVPLRGEGSKFSVTRCFNPLAGENIMDVVARVSEAAGSANLKYDRDYRFETTGGDGTAFFSFETVEKMELVKTTMGMR